jgi:hypothetical protein
MIAATAFLLAMPLTIYTLAGCLQVIDQVDPGGRFAALLSVSFRLLLFALLVLALPAEARLWIFFGAISALTLTFTASFLGRYVVRSGRWPTERIE